MDFNEFLLQRQPRWKQLSQLLDRVDQVGLAGLASHEVDELFSLYRLVSSDLNLVQTRTGNPTLLEYLETLVGRAYARLAVPRQSSFFRSWWTILRHYFPAELRRQKRLLAISFAAMLAGILFGATATLVSPRNAELFLGAEHLAESPSRRVAQLEEAERTGHSQISSTGENAFFASFLFTHNIRVTILGFALGFTFGIGTIAVLFSNGAMLGSLGVLYAQDGVLKFFLAWVGPHGSIELPCIIIGCTAGLMVARAQFRRDGGSFMSQLRRIRPALIDLLVGTASLLVVAGVIEGGFSQVNEPTLPYTLKIAVAVALFVALLLYVFKMPARGRVQDESHGLAKELHALVS